MNISRIHIDGFGIWHDRCWEGLSDRVNVFYGPNEAGKTTLMSFIRAVLFGFERRNHPRRYEPLDGGNHGGSLEVVRRGESVRIGRRAGRHVRGGVRIRRIDPGPEEPEATGDEAELGRILGGTTRTLYHNVFAFGLEELEQFRTLKENEVASHISGAAMGVGASRWSAVWKDLEDRRSGLFLPRGQKATINQALGELEIVRQDLDRTEAAPREYIEAHDERSRLEAGIGELENRVETLRRKLTHCEKLRAAEPHRKRRAQLEAELEKLEPVERFPDGGVERLNLLVHQRRQLESEAESERAGGRRLRQERAELTAGYSPQELLRRDRIVEGLRTHLPRLEAAEEKADSLGEAREAVRTEYASALADRDAKGAPSPVVTAAFSAVIAVVAGVLFGSGNPIAGGAVSATLVLIACWFYWKRRRASAFDRVLAGISARLEAAGEDLDRAREELDRIRRRLDELTGGGRFSYSDLEREAEAVRTLTATADRIRSIDEALAGEEQRRKRLEARIAETAAAIDKLLAEADALSEIDFQRRAEIFGRRRKLVAELDRTPRAEVASGDLDLAGLNPTGSGGDWIDDAGFRKLRDDLASGVASLQEARTEAGRLEERIATLSRSEERSRARSRQETIVARVDEASEKWAVLTLCKALLEETRRVYETDRQPEVLLHASSFFSRMSDGRWRRIVAPLGSEDLVVESAAGDRVSPEHLSRGTAEQLYLAMRLALVREYSNHVEPLPVIFDDIFVNFDTNRTRRALESVRELSDTHQVLLFTCHPHLVEMVRDVIAGTSIYRL